MKKRIRRAQKREADEEASRRQSTGKKPYVVQVRPTGIVDSGCIGHLKWQEYVRDMTPRMLDMSIIRYNDESESSKCTLREVFRKKFDFIENEMTDESMDKMIKLWLRKNRERTKRLYGGKAKPPAKYNDKQWDALKKYWDLPSSKLQSEKMSETRKKVVHNPRVGRHGYAGKSAEVVSDVFFSL